MEQEQQFDFFFFGKDVLHKNLFPLCEPHARRDTRISIAVERLIKLVICLYKKNSNLSVICLCKEKLNLSVICQEAFRACRNGEEKKNLVARAWGACPP